MKKNLLTVALLAAGLTAQAQILTYVDQGAKFYISSGALVYSGGDLMLNSNQPATIENNGNIIIVGDYKKGAVANAATDGAEFLNVYNGTNNYGQVQILSSQGTTNGRLTMQRPAATTAYFGSDYSISFPYNDAVTYLMRSFGKAESEFKGTCPVGSDCGPNRYAMTITKWNNNQVQHDAVIPTANFKAGDDYTINLRAQGGLQSAMTGIIGYKGTPAPINYNGSGKSVIVNMSEAAFSNAGYNDWKNLKNQYNELYKSYMGDFNSTSKATGKNVYRFGNPYTSNLDLSAFDGANAWLKILNNGGPRTIKQATDAQMIRNFYISKTTPTYDINWSPATGSSNGNNGFYMAKFDGTQWTGNAEALLIKPLQTFTLNFASINAANLGGTNIINAQVGFNDNHKTFSYTASAPGAATVTTAGKSSLGSATGSNTSSAFRSENSFGFYEAEVFLVKENQVIADPVYAVGANYYPSNSNDGTATNNNQIFLYGVKNDAVNKDSKNQFKEFNSDSYVEKPLQVGFNGLENGAEYELRFNLYSGSIFNAVKNLDSDKFYIFDKKYNKVTELSSDLNYRFTADGDADTDNGRFAIYWKGVPGTGTLAASDEVKIANKTFVYREGIANKVRFERVENNVQIDVYDISGKIVQSNKAINTASDFQLENYGPKGVYIVKVTYKNGDVRSLKILN